MTIVVTGSLENFTRDSAKEAIVSRGELIEIGAGFRLPELIESTATRLKEIGATNRTHLADYERALGDNIGAILKVHPSNFRIEGFTSAVGVEELHRLAVEHDTRLIVDLGSGLLTHDPALPEEPDIQAQLRAGAEMQRMRMSTASETNASACCW